MSRRRLKLLIVDDSRDDAELLLQELSTGFDVEHRRVETEAQLRQALEGGGFEAVITDVHLPGTDGRRILEVLREVAFPGPVIAVSGALSEEELVQAMKGGAHDYVTKGRLSRLTPALTRELEEAAQHEARRRVEAELGDTEAHLRSALENLREANRLKDEFLATVSHELRTPLTAILGWVHLLRSHTLDPSMAERALEVVERNAKAQAQLIGDILDVSRIVTGKLRLEPRPADLDVVIEAAADAIRPAAEAKRLRLEVDVEPDLGLVVVDADRLQQVVWNLLSNAVKFTPEDGAVHARVFHHDDHLEIAVTDTGSGIDAHLLPSIFDRFRQGDASSTRSHGGLGLGLAIVRHIVELHGGTAEATSPGPGRGSTFRVSLPLRLAPRSVSRRHTAAAVGPPGPDLAGLTVLVVDDDADTLDLVATVLRQRGAIAETASNVKDALARIREQRPEILLSDLAMPGQDGFDLIRELRSLPGGARVKAAALTAYARTEDRLRALWAGFETHIPKPVQPDELAAVVGSLAGRMGAGEEALTGPVENGEDR